MVPDSPRRYVALKTPNTAWWDDVFEVLKTERIRHVTTVPDGGLTGLLEKCQADPDINVVTLSTEEEGIAFACGAWMGGERSVLCMQSSGVGNCVNMLSLPRTCRIPCLMLVTMRGETGEFNPWQIPMGQAVPGVFDQLDVMAFRPSKAEEIGATFERAARLVCDSAASAAVLVSQRIIGAKDFQKGRDS